MTLASGSMRRRGASASGTATPHRSRTRASIREKYTPGIAVGHHADAREGAVGRRTGTAHANPFGAISDPK